MNYNQILQGECLEVLKTLPDEIIDCVMTSPPYWALRDYGVSGQLGLEPTFQEYITRLCDIFDEIKRVLKPAGTCFVNIGDTYFGGGNNRGNDSPISDKQKSNQGAVGQVQQDWSKMNYQSKCLCQIPSRFAIEMTNRGWILRNEIIWHKRNCMPSSITDRFTVDFEKLFFFTKSKKYSFEQQFEPFESDECDIEKPRNKGAENYGKNAHTGVNGAISEGTRDWYRKGARNKRCVWDIITKGYSEAHFATYPEELCITPIEAGCPKDGLVLDPFFGSGTTGVACMGRNRNYLGIELNPEYIKIAEQRLSNTTPCLL